MRFTAETRGCLKCKIYPRLTGGRTMYVCTNEFLKTKIYWNGCIHNQVHFSANLVHFHF